MSHFSTITVQIKDGSLLHETLRELGYTVACNTFVRGYGGDRVNADYVVRQANRYDLGFRQAGETYEFIADLWGADIDTQPFLNRITQHYAHKMLMATAQEQGFSIEADDVLPDGTVRVVVGKWV